MSIPINEVRRRPPVPTLTSVFEQLGICSTVTIDFQSLKSDYFGSSHRQVASEIPIDMKIRRHPKSRPSPYPETILQARKPLSSALTPISMNNEQNFSSYPLFCIIASTSTDTGEIMPFETPAIIALRHRRTKSEQNINRPPVHQSFSESLLLRYILVLGLVSMTLLSGVLFVPFGV